MYRLVTWRLPPRRGQRRAALPIRCQDWSKLLKPVQEFNPQAAAALCDLIHHCLLSIPLTGRSGPARCREPWTTGRRLVRAPKDRLEAMEW